MLRQPRLPLLGSRRPLDATQWLVTCLAIVAWAVFVRDAHDFAVRRGVVFLGGPAVLLAGLHARLLAYLHHRDRRVLSTLPLPPARHWHMALGQHMRALSGTLLLATVALWIALSTYDGVRLMPHGAQDWALLVEWGWLGLAVLVIEPCIAAAGAYFGRRFPETHRVHGLQVGFGGGWTLPEAVVHLYGPALGIGLAAALAMPLQLVSTRWLLDGRGVPVPLVAATAMAWLGVLAARVLVAPRMYTRGFWESVAWLAEATRTLAGPPRPERCPGWLRRIRHPFRRLLLLQLWRLSPLPGLRLALLVVVGVIALVMDEAPERSSAWIWVAMASGAWVVPNLVLLRGARTRARMFASLPVQRLARSGRDPWTQTALILGPVALLCVVVAVRSIAG